MEFIQNVQKNFYISVSLNVSKCMQLFYFERTRTWVESAIPLTV